MATLWNIGIGVGFFVAFSFLYIGFKRDPKKELIPFRPRDLVVGRRTLQETSRKQLLIEGSFAFVASLAAAIWRWM